MAHELSGGYEATSNYIPRTAEDSDGTKTVTTRRGLTLRNKLLAAAGGVVLAATLTACGPNGEPVETPTSTETPTPTETEQTYEELVASIEIEAGLDDQALAAAFVERKNSWWNAGTDPEIRDDPERDTRTIEEFGDYIAGQQKAAYIDALYANSNTADTYVEAAVSINGVTVAKYLQSLIRETAEYERTSEVITTELVDSGEGTRTLRITTAENTTDPTDAVNGQAVTYDITFVIEDGKEKISNAVFVK